MQDVLIYNMKENTYNMFRKYCRKQAYFSENSKICKMIYSSKQVINYCELSSSQSGELGFKFIKAVSRTVKLTDFRAKTV